MAVQEFVTKINLVNEETFQESGGSLQLYGQTHLAAFSANTVSVIDTPITGTTADVVLVWDSLDKRIKTVTQTSIAIQSPAAGNDTEVQFNKTGTTTGDPTFTFNHTNESLTLGSRLGVSGTHSFSQGCDNEASGYYSSASGYKTKASGMFSHTQGGCTLANSLYSHAEGFATSATSSGSHSEGGRTLASGAYSHAEGCFTDAGGVNSHAEGYKTYSDGSYSHAQGCYTSSSGIGSHSSGIGTFSRKVLACNTATFNHSFNDTLQTLGNGALAPYSAILGGKNHNISVLNSGATIIGGDSIKLTGSTYINTTVVGNLAIMDTPLSGGTGEDVVVWDDADKKLKIVSQSSLNAGGDFWKISGTTNVTNPIISGDTTFSGNINLSNFGNGLTFGDGDTGFEEISDDRLRINVGGGAKIEFQTNLMSGTASGTLAIWYGVGSQTLPIYSYDGDTTTGMGGVAGEISLITDGIEAINIDNTQFVTIPAGLGINGGTPTTTIVLDVSLANDGTELAYLGNLYVQEKTTTETRVVRGNNGGLLTLGAYSEIDARVALYSRFHATTPNEIRILGGTTQIDNVVTGDICIIASAAWYNTTGLTYAHGGNINLIGGASTGGFDDTLDGIGGDVILDGGLGANAGTDGNVLLATTRGQAILGNSNAWTIQTDGNMVGAAGNSLEINGAVGIGVSPVVNKLYLGDGYDLRLSKPTSGSTSNVILVRNTTTGIVESITTESISNTLDTNYWKVTGTTNVTNPIISGNTRFDGGVTGNTYFFGDGDTGFYETVDDQLFVKIGGIPRWSLLVTTFGSANGFGGAVSNNTASGTIPTLLPQRGTADTGVGGATGEVSLITGGIEGLNLNSNDISFYESNGTTILTNFDRVTSDISIGNGNTSEISFGFGGLPKRICFGLDKIEFSTSTTRQLITTEGRVNSGMDFKGNLGNCDSSTTNSVFTFSNGGSLNGNAFEQNFFNFCTTTLNQITVGGFNLIKSIIDDNSLSTTGNLNFINFDYLSDGATGRTETNFINFKTDSSEIFKVNTIGEIKITEPTSGSTSDQILTRNESSGIIEYRGSSTLGESNNIYSVTGVTGNTTLSSNEYVVLVDSSGGALTVTLPSSPTTNQAYKIKDKGNALTNNITIDGNGSNIDGSSTALINTDYGALELLFDSTEWFSLAFIN